MSPRITVVRLWRTADGRVVLDGDPDAAILIAAEGDEIPDGYDNLPTGVLGEDPEPEKPEVVAEAAPEKPEPKPRRVRKTSAKSKE